MSFNYAVTAYKPTAITAALTGNFTGPNDLNLIQAKGTYLVVNLVTPEGLKPVVDVNIYGRITIMQLFRPRVLAVLNNAHVLEPSCCANIFTLIKFNVHNAVLHVYNGCISM